MTAPVKERVGAITASAVAAFSAWLSRAESFEKTRNAVSMIVFVAASGIWLASLGRMDMSQHAIPWYVTIGFFASLSVRFLRVDRRVIDLVGIPKSREPLQLQETLATCFLLMAVALYICAGYALLNPKSKSKPLQITQVVDIQLLSERDVKDNKQELPASSELEHLRKRTADMISQTGSLAKSKQFESKPETVKKALSSMTPDKNSAKSEGKAQVDREDERAALEATSPKSKQQIVEAPRVTPLMVPSSWQTKVIRDFSPAAAKPSSPAPVQSSQPYISEVEPPELVELMENDGDVLGMHVFQKGGKTSGGKGAENGLSVYLKELHRKIKNAWAPPMGTDRQVVVLFRLKRDGHLEFLKLNKSSGEAETDKSAYKAIVLATTAAIPLPKDFSPKNLDVMYTFKYNVNELKEVQSSNAGNSPDYANSINASYAADSSD